MTLTFTNCKLENMPQGYYLAHATTTDFSMGGGVSKGLNKIFNLKTKLNKWHSDDSNCPAKVGDCITIDNIFNLIDKETIHDSVDYTNLKTCFESMKNVSIALNVDKIAMPKIGCGCDKLDWHEVKNILLDVFHKWSGNITICVLSDSELEEDLSDEDIMDMYDLDNDITETIYITNDDIGTRSKDDTIISISNDVDLTKFNYSDVVGLSIDNNPPIKYKLLFSTLNSTVFQKV